MQLHMSTSIRGMLEWPKKQFNASAKYVTKKDGTPFKPDELRDLLYDLLAEGQLLLPLGSCDNFDPKTGCRGHEDTESGRDFRSDGAIQNEPYRGGILPSTGEGRVGAIIPEKTRFFITLRRKS